MPPTSLFKYCSAETAKKILATGSLRWKAAHLLGDPLELNHRSELGFTAGHMLQGAIKTAASMIFAKDVPAGRAPLLAAIRRWRDEERFASPEEAEEVLHDLMTRMVDQRKEVLDQVMLDWRNFTRRLRICCFSSRADNLSAWQHQARKHSGVALRFQVEASPNFSNPHPVRYSTHRPVITNLKDQLAVLLWSEKHVAQDFFLEKFTVKAPDYSHQQEWRCFHEHGENDGDISHDESQWYLDRQFGDEDLKAIHFGACTSQRDKQEIFELVKEHYRSVKMFETRFQTGKYELDSERLTEKPG